MSIKPLKRFGQNYLTDRNIVLKMIQTLNISSTDSIIEIGPGKGFITQELLEKVNKLTAVEIDSRVIDDLKTKFPNLNLIQNDIQKIGFNKLSIGLPIKVIGNIPFNLTGNILFKLIYEKNFVDQAVLIIPYDIAKRIVATKRTKEYGILTVLFNYFSTSKIAHKISRNVFFPKPNLDAAIINIKFDKKESKNINRNLFIKVVKASFGNRRKTLKNSLRNSIFVDYNFSNLATLLTKRAEELEVADFIKLTENIQEQNV